MDKTKKKTVQNVSPRQKSRFQKILLNNIYRNIIDLVDFE